MYDRHAVGDAARFQPIGHEDYAFWLDLLHQGGPAVGVGGSEPVACYLVRDGSISSNKARAVKWQWHIYRRHQGLGLLARAWYLANYATLAVMQRRSPRGATLVRTPRPAPASSISATTGSPRPAPAPTPWPPRSRRSPRCRPSLRRDCASRPAPAAPPTP